VKLSKIKANFVAEDDMFSGFPLAIIQVSRSFSTMTFSWRERVRE
jgi:hypothetical protein